jgi:prepilin-type processing-associated H-X9-DG protein
LIPALAKARLAAKKAVCLNTVKQLTLAWMAYSSNNDEKLVNGGPLAPGGPPPAQFSGSPPPIQVAGNSPPSQNACPPPVDPSVNPNTAAKPGGDEWSGSHLREVPWVGPGWAFDGTGITIWKKQQPACNQRVAMQTGALWSYVKDEKTYCCPTGEKGELITYSIMDCMNGMWLYRSSITGDTDPPQIKSRWYKTSGAIRKPSSKTVFIDEGHLSPDSFAVRFDDVTMWYDPPPVRHGGGVVVSYGDGHSAYWKWRSKYTVDAGTLALTAPPQVGVPIPTNLRSDVATVSDCYKMEISCWGELPNVAYKNVSDAVRKKLDAGE